VPTEFTVIFFAIVSIIALVITLVAVLLRRRDRTTEEPHARRDPDRDETPP
jgi:Flp pilus assembly protein protease CpaA